MRARHQTRGDQVAEWIEDYCVVPSGPDRGKPVRLTEAELYAVRQFYDCPAGPQDQQVEGNLAAYLALLHTCGIEVAMARGLSFTPILGRSGMQQTTRCCAVC